MCQALEQHSVQPPSPTAGGRPPSCMCTHSTHYTAPAAPAVSAADFCRSPSVAVCELGRYAAATVGWLSTIRSSGRRLDVSCALCWSMCLLVLWML